MKMYQFTFTKKRVIGVATAICMLNFLAFFGGLVLGLGLWMPTKSEIAMATEYKAKMAGQQSAPAAVPPSTAPAQTASAAAAPASQRSSQPRAAPPATQPISEQPLDKKSVAGRFALQIGSFTDPKTAKQLETDLKDRGYMVRIFKALDPEQKVWHVVRIGEYPDVSAASRAAAEFTSREQLQALVRRSDNL